MYDIHGAVHDAFMMLPAYTRISEDEVQELGLGVSNGSHRALSDPLSEQSERFERPCEATSAEGTARWASRGKPVPSRFLLSSCSKGSRGSPQRCAIGECPRASTLIRGHRHDYNRWQELGNTGWSYDDVLPYFKKAEDQERGASAYHGVGGPLHVMDLHHVSPRSLAFVEAGVKLGWLRNDDCNGACQEGFGICQVTQRAGKRESTADCYLRPALHRPNLTVMTEALVARVLFEGCQAVGVAYLKDGAEHQIRAHNEVILSGSTINSPQLLMLSGIGPAEHLRTVDSPVVVALPGVGYHLQDHPCLYISYKIAQPGSLYTGGEGNAYIKSRPELPEPDMQMLFTPSLLSGEHSGYAEKSGRGQAR